MEMENLLKEWNCLELLPALKDILEIFEGNLQSQLSLNTIRKLQEWWVIPQNGAVKCPHGSAMKLSRARCAMDGYLWMCSLKHSLAKKKKKRCGKRCSLRKNTFFDGSKMSLFQIVTFSFLWLKNLMLKRIIKIAKISIQTALDWGLYYREMIKYYVWNLHENIANLVTIERLKYLTTEDLKELIPLVGPRAEFREKLFNWKNSNPTVETPSAKVVNNTTPMEAEPIQSHFINLPELMEKNDKIRSARKYYEKHNFLMENHRADIIKVILDAVFEKDDRLSVSDISKITDTIVSIFPTESKEYYYIPRGKRKGAGGKLYDKFYNMKYKKRKLENSMQIERSQNLDTSVSERTPEVKVEEYDLNSDVKEFLREYKTKSICEESGTPRVSQEWESTFSLRRIELDNSKVSEAFLNEWPALKQPFGYLLIQYDFITLYPGKENAIHEKWPEFKHIIDNFYGMHIKDRRSRDEFLNRKQITQKDSLDYLTLKLLHSVLLPTARYKNKDGRTNLKYTISDAQECFALHLISLSEFPMIYDEFEEKYLNENDCIRPTVVIIGKDQTDLKEFYVHFNGIFYSFPTYLESVTGCFQIFQVFNLPYPKASQNVWMFIQKYFFEISNQYDISGPSLAVLYNYLNAGLSI